MIEVHAPVRTTGRKRVRNVLGTGVVMALFLTVAVAGTAGASKSSGLNNLQKELQNESKAKFEATYIVTNQGSSNSTMVLAQSPPNSYMKSSGATLISTGKKTYYCSTESGSATTCVSESGANPLAGLAELFSSTAILTEVRSFSGELAAHIAGLSVKTSSKTVAGQPSTCVTVKSASSQKSEWCVTNSNGVLTYENSGTNSVTLKSFTSSPPSSLFTLPSGATVVTTPTIPGT